MKFLIVLLGVAGLATCVAAQQNTNLTLTAPAGGLKADGGGDIRVREEAIDNIPYPTTTSMHQDYLRFRTRVWGQLGNDSVSLYGRLANEWRDYHVPNVSRNCAWPDETVLDNLYLDIKGLFDDRLSLRIGRQDLSYGAGRVIFEGTPGDGSRTLFFDALKATVKLSDTTKLDVLGIYNSPKTDLLIHDANHPLTQLVGAKNNNLTESGAGLVLNTKSVPELPTEFYYIWKHESDWRYWNAAGTAYTPEPARDVHTFGARTTPKIGSQFEGDFEAALQLGRVDDGQNILAGMAYAGVAWLPPVDGPVKPYIKPACYYLSGDDNSNDYPNGNRALRGSTDTAWDPIWGRYPQLSELYVLSYNGSDGVGYWSNLIFPHVETGFKITDLNKFSLRVGPLLAAEADSPAGGRNRGWLTVARYDFPVLMPVKDSLSVLTRRLTVFGHLQAEFFTPEDYYPYRSMSYFLRWELDVKF